jgi:signal transduction histidine kinase
MRIYAEYIFLHIYGYILPIPLWGFSMFTQFLVNSILTIALCLVGLTASNYVSKKFQPLLWGVVFGLGTLVTMRHAIHIDNGLFFDFRNITMALGSFMGGVTGFAVSSIIAAGYRYYLGGIGAVGGVMTIVSFGIFGLLLSRYVRWKDKTISGRVWLWMKTGLALSILALLLIYAYPPWGVDKLAILAELWMPFLAITPFVTCLLFLVTLETGQMLRELNIFRGILRHSPMPILIFDQQNRTLLASDSLGRDGNLSHLLNNPLALLPENGLRTLNGDGPAGSKDYTHTVAEEFHYAVRLFPLSLPNREKIHIAMLQNITDAVHQQKTINLLSRYEMVGQMAAGLSHEVKNPITTVRGFLQLFQKNPKRSNLSEEYEYMICELDRAVDVISELLSLGRDRERMVEPADLNDILSELFPIFEANAFKEGKDVQLTLGHIPNIMVDVNEMKQVIVNLVKNGLESMEKGTVSIETALVDDRVQLSIRDQGTGISSESMEKIGTPFFTTKEGGTGIGLAYCYKIVLQHQATIHFESGEDGTTFYIRFKAVEVPRNHIE